MFKKNQDGKFGTLQGVLIPNILQMVGAILFLRLGFVLGNVGIGTMSAVISLSALILFLTGFSLTAIVTNMRMHGGGAYYLISRSLGIEFGSALGILSCTAQLCSIALCTTGFAVSLQELFPLVPIVFFKVGTLVTLLGVAYFSTNFALKTQIFIFLGLVTSLAAIFLGSQPPSPLLPVSPFGESLSFWGAFALFFPAMTGIESGMAMSGDLRSPSRSLPIGTISSVALVYALYMGMAWFLASFIPLEILRSHPFILYHVSKVAPLVLLGIWTATLSSALGGLLGGPRVMQAVAKDGILPSFLAKGYGVTNQPRVATLVVFSLAMALTIAAEIDQIIPMLTIACLVSYGLLNFIAFFESFVQNPSWRPSFRVPWGVSLTGALGCLFAMFLINPGASFLVVGILTLFCIWTGKRKLQGNWDDLKHSLFSFFVQKGAVRLSHLEASAKSWRPHILTLFPTPAVEKNLAYFSHALNQGKGFLTFGAIVSSKEEASRAQEKIKQDLVGFKIPSHLHLNVCPILDLGRVQMIQNYGFGFLKPNTVFLSAPKLGEESSFVDLLLSIHDQQKNVVVLKHDGVQDYLFSDSTRKEKLLQLWWRGKYPGNFELCLAFAYLLQQSPLWPKARICIKTITKNVEQKEKLLSQFAQYKKALRIGSLDFASPMGVEEDFFPTFTKESKGADLTFLGLKQPEKEQDRGEYLAYFQQLLEQTKEIGNIAFVLSGEKVEFQKIFRD